MWDTVRRFRQPGDVLPNNDHTIDGYVDRGGYKVIGDVLDIHDPVWGHHQVGGHPSEHVLFELGLTDVFRRLMGVFQLTLPHLYETIPNAGYLSRWHHVWGCIILARNLCRQMGLSREETSIYVTRTALHDGGTRSGSHLADWALSELGVHGGENQHDLDLRSFLERSGICDILRKHGLDPDAVVMPDGANDFVECPQPRDNVDRADYRQREMMLYMDTPTVHGIGLDSFVVIDNQLVMRNVDQAWAAGVNHMLLSAEHWSDAIHRLIEMLYLEMYKQVFVGNHGSFEWFDRNPADVLFCSDAEQILAMSEHNVFNAVLDQIIRPIALYERQIGWPLRRMRLWDALGEPGGGWPFLKMYPRSSPFVAVEEASEPPGSLPDDALYVYLPPFKARQIEPLVLQGTDVVTLSDLRPEFAELREAHAQEMAKGHIARVGVMDRGAHEMIRATMAEHQTEWPKLLELPHMDTEELREHLHMAAGMANMTDLVDYDPD